MSDRSGAHSLGAFVSGLGVLSAGLGDEQLYERAGIEVEAQRRPSETYSAALLPAPRGLVGFGRWRVPSAGLTEPSAISAARCGGIEAETICATGRPRRVTVIGSPASTRSMIELALSFNSRMPTVAFSIGGYILARDGHLG